MTIKKIGLDYFSVDTDIFSDEKIQFITAKYGLKGEAIIFRLLSRIYRQGYYYPWNEDQCLLMSVTVNGDSGAELIQDVIDEAIRRSFFDAKLYEKYGILTSHRIQKDYLHSTARRKNVNMVHTFLLIDEHDDNIMNENVNIIGLNDDILPHSIA